MSSRELDIAPGVSNRRTEITDIDAKLRNLNARFPGERKKPNTDKNPEYLAARNGILERRQLLSGMQYQTRRTLRGMSR